MSEVQDQDLNQDQATDDQANQQDQQPTEIEQKMAELEARYKAQIKGLDQKVSKLAKEKESLEMEKLSETERAEAERKKALAEADEIRAETAKIKRERDLTKVLFNKGLDPELFADRLLGDDLDSMEQDAEKLQAAINKAVEAGIEKEIARRLGGKVPEGGKTTAPLSVEEQIKRAKILSSGRKY